MSRPTSTGCPAYSSSTLPEWCSRRSAVAAPERSVAIKRSRNGSSTSSTASDAVLGRRSSADRSTLTVGQGCAGEAADRMQLIGEDAGAHAGVVVHDRAGVLRGCGEDGEAGDVAVVGDR